jgi:PAS domain S-box-containing protein
VALIVDFSVDACAFLNGGGEMGALIRAFDWSGHALGPPLGWPENLRIAAGICLGSRFPLAVCWGPEHYLLYNDSYRDLLATKHPRALGQRAEECWFEIRDYLAPLLAGVIAEGRASWADDLMLPLQRKGYPEECYFTFSSSPIAGRGGGVDGVFTAITETTKRVVDHRRFRTLGSLGVAMAAAESREDVLRAAVATLALNASDVPVALGYALRPGGSEAALVAGHGYQTRRGAHRPVPALDASGRGWPLAGARAGPIEVEWLPEFFGEMLPGRSPEPVRTALVVPIARTDPERPEGLLVVGLNPRRPLDADYQSFLGLCASQIAAAIGNAEAREEDRRRAQKLAELDKAKSEFFSNVSHELRTPLTLILGVTERLRGGDGLSDDAHHALDVVDRNARALVGHVGQLLDAARFDAGKLELRTSRVDLTRLVRQVAGQFEVLASEKQIRYDVDAGEPLVAWADGDKVERVVLNLLSNAFEYTPPRGTVRLAVATLDGEALLSVDDSGPGVPEADRERIFERFWRGERGRSRGLAGTGLGLAICRELVELHHGSIAVGTSEAGGARFEVRLPLDGASAGTDEPGRLVADGTTARLRQGVAPPAVVAASDPASASIDDEGIGGSAVSGLVLVVEDHSDMRSFLAAALAGEWRVATARGGAEGLAKAVALRPDLVLTDLMMPDLDGRALVAELRSRREFDATPILVLTARADDALRGDLLEVGNLDYLLKPFEVRELRARTRNLVSTKRAMDLLQSELAVHDRDLEVMTRELLHRQQESRSRERLFAQAQEAGRVGTWSWDVASDRVLLSRELCRIFGLAAEAGVSSRAAIMEQVHPEDRRRVDRLRLEAIEKRQPLVSEHRIVRPGGETRTVFVRGELVLGDGGQPAVLAGICHDVTEERAAEAALRESERRLREAVDHYPDVFVIYDCLRRFRFVNRRGLELSGLPPGAILGRTDEEVFPTAITGAYLPLLGRAIETRSMRAAEVTVGLPQGTFAVHVAFVPLLDDEGNVREVLGVTRDLTDQRKAERASLEHLDAERQARAEAEHALHRLKGIQRVTEAALADVATDDLLRELLKRVRRVFGADRATILLLSEDRESLSIRLAEGAFAQAERDLRVPYGLGIAGTIAATRQATIVPDLSQADVVSPFLKSRMRSLMGVPLLVESEVLGVLHVSTRQRRSFTSEDLALLQTVAHPIALALDRSRLFEEVRSGRSRLEALSRRLVDLQEAERQEIARELHDEVGQLLTGLKVLLEREARRVASAGKARSTERREEMRRIVNDLMARVRDLSMDLRPPMLDDFGLSPTLVWHLERFQAQTGVEVDFRPTALRRRYAAQVETAVFRIVQEALTNVARHAGVRRARVEVSADRSGIRLVVQDSGRGFDAQAVLARPSSGLSGMRERARLLGGQLAIESSPGVGARLTARIPLRARARPRREDAP